MHPAAAWMYGFNAGGQTRNVDGQRTLGLRLGDRFGTVPGLAAGDERISTNHSIARFLDEHHPEHPLLPADPAQRQAVEEVESWANETLQMAARKLIAVAVLRDPDGYSRTTGEGRLGPLLYKSTMARRWIVPQLLRQVFNAETIDDAAMLTELEQMLDRTDAWIDAGVTRRRGAQRRRLHGRAEPGADPLPAGRGPDLRGAAFARPRRPAAAGPDGAGARRPGDRLAAELGVGLEPAGEGDEQLDRALHVRELDTSRPTSACSAGAARRGRQGMPPRASWIASASVPV